MKRFLILILLAMAIPCMMMAKIRSLKDKVNTGNPKLDNLLVELNGIANEFDTGDIDKLSLDVYIKGSSKGIQLGRVARLLPNILPFETHPDRTTAVEALCQVNYQNPCQMQFTPIALRTNSKAGKRIIKESYQVLLPLYAIKRMKDRGSDKYYVLPISDDGLEQYNFSLIDTLTHHGEMVQIIEFSPKRKHHTLSVGYFIVGLDHKIKALSFSGNVDFGKVDYYVSFEENPISNVPLPKQSHVSISYNYSGSTGVNEFDCFFVYKELTLIDKTKKRKDELNLTSVYDKEFEAIDFDTIRPVPLSFIEDSILTAKDSKVEKKRSLYQVIPEKLVGSSNINAFGNDLKIYGPLYPASFGYDKINGVTLRERLRFSHLYDNGKSLIIKPDFGYSFKLKEFRYKLDAEWIYSPKKRGGFKLSARNKSSDFSSYFKNSVDQVLADTSNLHFEDLNIDYYRSHEWKLEHSIEICNGLSFFSGFAYNYRDPNKHGSKAMSHDRIDDLVKDHYTDFTPYIRLIWTPRQYYYYKGNQKLYIGSYYPTFSLEIAKGIKNVWRSSSDYERFELDIQHAIKLGDFRTISYHIGGGSFLKQKGEYFINYSYFSRSMYPSTWDDHIGGVFNLLDDYWYNSSPAYIQAHLMYESPFMLLHFIRPLSKYVIKERIYTSHLWANGKNAYTEIGYGMGNNYFNFGLFSSFIGFEINEVGVKFSVEIDSHW